MITYNLSTKLSTCDPWETVLNDANNRGCPLLFAQLTTLYGKILPSICFISYIFLISDMSLSPSASFLLLYNSTLPDYTTQTITLGQEGG
jgi:hypothetical protein